ncbi:MAG: hypothetical protein COB67_08850 [SAR324 cluster bacterium]|uniref:Uncharacterized protein n=1 Tax=SAR324 cluster bacterium TaxID=2024889 RepID=A0A2A4T0Y1_9DELT|nr:MAG: hypothetical protein COB67_08850 [SAR324 cluster bacterium]
MNKINELVEYINNANPSAIALMIFLGLFFNFKSIVEFLDSRKKVKISKLEEALKNENLKGLDKELLENELTKEHFKVTIGLDVEKEFREAIIKIFKKTKGELAFKHFQRALFHMEYRDNELSIKISIYDNFSFYYNLLVGISFSIIGLTLFAYGVLTFSTTSFISILGLSLLVIGIGIFSLHELFPIISAKKVLKELEKQKELIGD